MPALTKRAVDAMRPGDKPLWDGEVKGFGVKVNAKGSRTYVLTYRAPPGGRNAAKRWFTLGLHGSPWTVEEARKEAKRLLGLVADGADPAAEKQEARAGHGDTVAEVFESYLTKHARPKLRSAPEVERIIRADVLPVIGRTKIADVTKRQVMTIHDRVADRGEAMARGTVRALSAFLGWAVKRDLLDKNPCIGLALEPAEARERVLTPAEVAEVIRAADTLGHPWALLVRMLALTGQRLREVAEARWSELDLGAGLWTLPPERTKNKREHKVPLPADLASMLGALPRLSCTDTETGKVMDSPFLFTTTGRTPVSGFSVLKRRLDAAILAARRKADPKAETMPDWRLHDLRRSCASGLGELGFAVSTIERALNHVSGAFAGLVSVYQKQTLQTERERAFAAWEGCILAALDGKEAGSNVVPLAAGRAV